ncbi:MAG: carboxypeptidase-like regulatory domain-containing protein [Bacteroidetes bacterium]|nr:carboxypeptidase-like regulatory domain-containing protein [Bacteroidota bacterium]
MKLKHTILGFLICFTFSGMAQVVTVKGLVADVDSVSPMPFVYVIDQTTGNGLMSDFNGKFVINADLKDTVLFSFVGYLKLRLPVKSLYHEDGSETKVIMKQMSYNLNQVVVSDFKLKPYEKDYMKRVIEGSHMPVVNALQSPISALYQQFSKKGKEQRKLARIFEELFEKEEVAKKFNPEVLRKLTGDENIDFEEFRKYCFYLSNDYILTHEGYDLYYRVMDCYYRWKSEKR